MNIVDKIATKQKMICIDQEPTISKGYYLKFKSMEDLEYFTSFLTAEKQKNKDAIENLKMQIKTKNNLHLFIFRIGTLFFSDNLGMATESFYKEDNPDLEIIHYDRTMIL